MATPRKRESKPRPKVRVRRAPDEARRLILNATSELLIAQGPDAIGLKDVAARAGVSHALVTHYFGTKDSLFEEAIAAHSLELRQSIISAMDSEANVPIETLIGMLLDSLTKANAGRLAAWLMLSGRVDRADFFSQRQKGAKRVVDLVMNRFANAGLVIPRDRIEFAILLVLTAAHGYALGRKPFLGSLGVEPTKERDLWFRRELAAVLTRLAVPAHDTITSTEELIASSAR